MALSGSTNFESAVWLDSNYHRTLHCSIACSGLLHTSICSKPSFCGSFPDCLWLLITLDIAAATTAHLLPPQQSTVPCHQRPTESVSRLAAFCPLFATAAVAILWTRRRERERTRHRAANAPRPSSKPPVPVSLGRSTLLSVGQCHDDANHDRCEPPIPFSPTPFRRPFGRVQIICTRQDASSP